MCSSNPFRLAVVSLALVCSAAPPAHAEEAPAALAENVPEPAQERDEEAARLAGEIAATWRTATETGAIRSCAGVIRSPWQAVEGVEASADWLTGAAADPAQSFAVWTAAQRIRFGIEMVRGLPGCAPGHRPETGPGGPMLAPDVDAWLIQTLDALLARVDRTRSIPYYEPRAWPDAEPTADFFRSDLIDVFEARVRASEYGDPEQERPPEELRRLVYVAALTAYDLDRAAPLQELLTALEADDSLQDAKRELLLLRTRIALALVRYEDATEAGC